VATGLHRNVSAARSSDLRAGAGQNAPLLLGHVGVPARLLGKWCGFANADLDAPDAAQSPTPPTPRLQSFVLHNVLLYDRCQLL